MVARSWEMHVFKAAKCKWCRERLLFPSYHEVVEPEMDRRFLAVEEGKHQEGVVEAWHQDGPEEGLVSLAAEQLLCTICDTHLKHENMNAVLDSSSLSI